MYITCEHASTFPFLRINSALTKHYICKNKLSSFVHKPSLLVIIQQQFELRILKYKGHLVWWETQLPLISRFSNKISSNGPRMHQILPDIELLFLCKSCISGQNMSSLWKPLQASTMKWAHVLLNRLSITPFRMVKSRLRITRAISKKTPRSLQSISMRRCPGYARSSTTIGHICRSFPNSKAQLFPLWIFTLFSDNLQFLRSATCTHVSSIIVNFSYTIQSSLITAVSSLFY